MEALIESLDGVGQWMWARHHNLASWYVRPLFVLAYCWFAYRRSRLGLAATVLIFPTSLFWFPAPEHPSPAAQQYLALEAAFFTASPWRLGLLAVLVLGFLWALAAAFWRRSWRWGLAVLNLGTLVKLAWGFLFGEQGAGIAAVAPALFTLLVCNLVVLALVWVRARRGRNGERTGDF